MTTIPLSTHSLRSKQIYGGDPMEGTEASGRSFARSRIKYKYAAHLRGRQTKPPTEQASFRPKKERTFSFNFLIE